MGQKTDQALKFWLEDTATLPTAAYKINGQWFIEWTNECWGSWRGGSYYGYSKGALHA